MGWQQGGSRERLDVRQFYGPLYPPHRIDAMDKTLRWVIPGSRLLASLIGPAPRWVQIELAHLATGQSGSPPGPGTATRAPKKDDDDENEEDRQP
jgi:hypothetical protein